MSSPSCHRASYKISDFAIQGSPSSVRECLSIVEPETASSQKLARGAQCHACGTLKDCGHPRISRGSLSLVGLLGWLPPFNHQSVREPQARGEGFEPHAETFQHVKWVASCFVLCASGRTLFVRAEVRAGLESASKASYPLSRMDKRLADMTGSCHLPNTIMHGHCPLEFILSHLQP
ncbi:uncharacterized protein B0I36DRAFT_113507 [Microdochium trichocladiopsis]|uniref:Uncharacterized protein n=1 Tax=Microdochium trichocladiopsis TaxID=1682393 RepID=A0A9P8Y5K2_9PEZI|nr:uncharacterized protein B0I36DRAFT_113507 [Microdochium trichocladiopsis]KAH7030746.1 hypothetical protein B0I36DRAFT_113507 [Microdochium trichocladiopsis]